MQVLLLIILFAGLFVSSVELGIVMVIAAVLTMVVSLKCRWLAVIMVAFCIFSLQLPVTSFLIVCPEKNDLTGFSRKKFRCDQRQLQHEQVQL